MQIFFQIIGIFWSLIVSFFTTIIPAVFSVFYSFLPVYKFMSSINDYLICGLLGLPIIPFSIVLIKFVRKNITKSINH